MSLIFKMFIFQKKNKNADTTKQKYFFDFWGPTRVWPCSYVFPSGIENQGYVVLWWKC